MSSSLPDGATVRAAGEEDADDVALLLAASERAARGESTVTGDDLRGWMRLANLPEASWLIEHDGTLVAAGIGIEHAGALELSAAVHPEHRGRGYGTALLDLGEACARRLGARTFRAGAMAEEPEARRLLEFRGYRDVRHYFTMRIDFDAPPPAPEWPEGVAGRVMRRDEARELYETLNEAFEDEWGWAPLPFDEWLELRVEGPGADPSLCFVAHDGEGIAAAARCERLLGAGWVGAIGVRKRARGRGVGLALLRYAFGEFHARGERTVRLGVDALNPTGALRLYERAGMHVQSEQIVYETETA